MLYNWDNIREFKSVYETINNKLNNNIEFSSKSLINTFMDNLEKFFYYAIKQNYITSSNIKIVLYRLSQIENVGYLIDINDYQKSKSLNNKKSIYFSKNLRNDELSFRIFKELSFCISSFDMNFFKESCNNYLKELNGKCNMNKYEEYEEYLDYGINLIEEVIDLEMARNIYSKVKNFNEIEILCDELIPLPKFSSSFKNIGMLIFKGINTQGKKLSNEEILFNIKRETLKKHFSYNLMRKLLTIFGKDNTFELLLELGIIYKHEIDKAKGINKIIKSRHSNLNVFKTKSKVKKQVMRYI